LNLIADLKIWLGYQGRTLGAAVVEREAASLRILEKQN